MSRPGWVALAAGGAAAVTMLVASLVGPPESVVSEHPAEPEPVVRTSLVCPFVDGEEDGTAPVGVFALPDVAVADVPGEPAPITVTALAVAAADGTPVPAPTANPEPVVSVAERGRPVVSEIRTSQGTSFEVSGHGVMAPGLAAEQMLIVQEPDLRGISTTSCTAPSREQWFVGGSGEVGRRGRIILANPAEVPAVVNLTVWDESGPVNAAGTQDVAVPARSQRVLLLDALAPGAVAAAVRVSTSRGRVAAALEMRETAGITPQGMTYVPAAAAPATEVVIPGVPRHGKHSLRIVAPGETDAIVSLRILGPEGPYSPLDQDVLTVPAGGVLETVLDVARDSAYGIRLISDQPVTAAVRVVDMPREGLPEVSYTAATPALSGPAVALLSRAASGFSSTVAISSVVDVASRVTVRVVAADGTDATDQTVDVPPGATVPVELIAPDGMVHATAIVQPEAPGTVVATREIVATDDDGVLTDLMPLRSSTTVVDVPEVVGELPSVPEDPLLGK